MGLEHKSKDLAEPDSIAAEVWLEIVWLLVFLLQLLCA